MNAYYLIIKQNKNVRENKDKLYTKKDTCIIYIGEILFFSVQLNKY